MIKLFDQNSKFSKILIPIIGVVLIVAIIGGSYYLGYIQGTKQTKNIVVQGVTNPQGSQSVDFSSFWDVWNLLKSKYVNQDATKNNQNLLYGAISGMVSAVGDPYTIFFKPQDAQQFNQDISGQFGGIGAEIGADKNGQIVVIAPMKDTPAQKAGLQPEDKILAIDGKSTSGLTVDQAVNKIRGDKGSKVVLTIIRNGWTKEKDFPIIRSTINVPTLDYKRIGFDGKDNSSGPIAYIQLYNFYEQSPMLFYQAALKSYNSGVKGMILDLRSNPGGYLEAAVNIAGWFVDKDKTVVTEEFRDKSQNQVYASEGPAIFKDLPMVVLIDKGSASASEILAGALKEDKGATIMGEKSFGKGTVQELLPLNDDSMIKITVAHWLTPNGNLIDKNGISPDISLSTTTLDQATTITQVQSAQQEWVVAAAKQLQSLIKVQK